MERQRTLPGLYEPGGGPSGSTPSGGSAATGKKRYEGEDGDHEQDGVDDHTAGDRDDEKHNAKNEKHEGGLPRERALQPFPPRKIRYGRLGPRLDRYGFTRPGHRQRRGIDPRVRDVMGVDPCRDDLLASAGLPDRCFSNGYLHQAEELMADAVGAEHAFFSTCGS